MDPSRAPKYNNTQIERKALEVLKLAYPDGIEVPIDIDFVAQGTSLVDDIVPANDLERKFDASAVIVYKADSRIDILVDDETYRVRSGRGRFSIAHELGHVVLHRVLWEQCRTIEDVMEMYDRARKNHDHIERSANKFAEYILMPEKRLLNDASTIYEEIVRRFGFDSPEAIQSNLVSTLARRYKVSVTPMEIRFNGLDLPAKVNIAIKSKIRNLEF